MDATNKNKVYLRALEIEDEEFLIKLRRNKDLFQLTCGNTYFISAEHSRKMLQEHILENQKQLYLVICLEENNAPIGYLSITSINHVNKSLEWGGVVIDPKFTGKGFATDAAKLMLKFVFEEMNMNRLYGYWLEENVASLRISEKLGFVKEGVLREVTFKTGKYHNVILCSMLKKDYDANYKTQNE